MRIDLSFDDNVRDVLTERVQTQLRWAFGSYASEVRSAKVGFRSTKAGIECAVHMRLRGRRELKVEGLGRDLEDALRFAGERARAAIARKLGTDRLLGR